MAMGFLKRLFGGGAEVDAAPVPVPPPGALDSRTMVEEARAASRRIRRDRDPLEWAQARQLLGNALIQLAGERAGDGAISLYEEAESVLAEAIDIAGPDADPGFLASMINLSGCAAFRRGERLEGEAKVGAYTDATRRFTTALEKITPDTQRPLWVDLGFYRGAAFQALGLLEDGADAIRYLDEAAASFRAVAEHGTDDGTIHPIAAYNLHVVLQDRARVAPGREALPFLTEARRALLHAMATPAFEASKADNASRLAVLDAAISAAGTTPSRGH